LETETSDEDLARKGASSGKSPATVRLAGRLVLVADDDPAALWFIADLLRAEGCEVIEATTGSDALALAQRFSPEAFVLGTMLDSGDGQELGDVLRKDIVLRDRPILLLTGSDDVVMRLRTLGAGAASFLPKDTDRESLLRALRQMVRPRHDLEERLRLDDDAGGTLDSMGVPTVLEVVTLWRPNSQLRFRNAKVRYELEIREGALQNVARTDQDGERQEGPGLLPGLLTLSNAQFIVTRPSHAAARAEARASLREDVETALANLRGTVATVSGPRLFRIERLLLDGDQLPLYLANVPPLYRGCVHALAAGASPKELAASGLAGPSIVERVLGDMALHGLILSVHDTQGDELLGPAVAKSLASNADRPLMALPTVCSELPGRDSSLDRASHLPTLGDAVASAVSSEDDGLPLPGLPDRRSSSVAQRPHPQGPPKGAEERSETARRRWLLSWLGLGTFV
jgi:DNA-binding response OmpR family regulator